MDSVVIIGAGQAGFQCAVSLREGGFTGQVTVLGDEPFAPYSRPPLSKTALDPASEWQPPLLRSPEFFAEKGIELLTGHSAVSIDRGNCRVQTSTGGSIPYDHLVLATGSRPRHVCGEGLEGAGVHYLRGLRDAQELRAALPAATRVAVVGGGFIGLEVAALCRKLGKECAVVELAPRIVARAGSEPLSEFLLQYHLNAGVNVWLQSGLKRVLRKAGSVAGLELNDGTEVACDLVLVGIGVVCNSELAADAGLRVQDGIVVDELLQTSDPRISAIGDCARFPTPFSSADTVRVESVQNASDQARAVAARLLGARHAYAALPWFWSDQGGAKLQIAGLTQGYDEAIVKFRSDSAIAVYCFRDDVLIGVECVNRPADFVTSRRIIRTSAAPTASALKERLAASLA